MRRLYAAVVIAVLALAVAVPAWAGVKSRYTHAYYSVKHAHGAQAPGRNIRRDGVVKKHGKGVRPATPRELRRSYRTLHRMLHPPAVVRYLNPAAPRTNAGGIATLRATSAPLAAIRQCESGGNYSTNTGNGFYGAYQFTASTWRSVGGSGLPSSASPAEQDRRAAMLHAREGATPWPVCGR